MPLNGFKLSASAPPTVNNSGAVSPATLAIPKIIAVTKPLLAAGITIMATVRHWVAPKANHASRRSVGINFKTSSEVLATVGIIKIASAIAPATAL